MQIAEVLVICHPERPLNLLLLMCIILCTRYVHFSLPSEKQVKDDHEYPHASVAMPIYMYQLSTYTCRDTPIVPFNNKQHRIELNNTLQSIY